MHTAQKTAAGEALREMLPDGADPYATLELAFHTAFLARDINMMPDLIAVVASDPELAAGLIVTLAALVDIDQRPEHMLDWLGTYEGREQETVRLVGALTEARQEYDIAAADTLPEVTLESMRAVRHNAKLAGVLMPCGTTAAYSRHINRKQKPCTRCNRARYLYDNATPEQKALLKEPLAGFNKMPQPPLKPPTWRPNCGKRTGYRAHKTAQEEPCDSCYEAIRSRSIRKYDERRAREGKPARQPTTRVQDGQQPADWVDGAMRELVADIMASTA